MREPGWLNYILDDARERLENDPPWKFSDEYRATLRKLERADMLTEGSLKVSSPSQKELAALAVLGIWSNPKVRVSVFCLSEFVSVPEGDLIFTRRLVARALKVRAGRVLFLGSFDGEDAWFSPAGENWTLEVAVV